jgi:hypothetical protein
MISLLSVSALFILMMPSTQAQNYGTSQTGTRRAYSSYGSPSSGSNSYNTPTSGSSSYSTPTSVPSTGSAGSSSFGAISTPVGSNNQGNPTNNGSPASQNSAMSNNPPSTSSGSTDSTNNNNNSSTATSSTGSDLNSTSSTRSSKFGSFMRGLKHDLNSSGVVRNPGYQNSNFNSPSSGTGLNTQTNGMPQVPPGASVVRNLDGTYRINAPGVNVNQSFRMQERAPQISGDVTTLVTSNMPIAVTSDIDSLFPQELHAKAYGPELKRNAPLNGAEGRN